jgi:hypothetical protein
MLKDPNTRSMAIMATRHCLIGCGIGEVLGMIISTIYGFSNLTSIVLSIILAFAFGYTLTFFPLVKSLSRARAARTALAADSVSITSMEIVDNTVIVFIPGALNATLSQSLFWFSLALSLVLAFIVTVPVNYWLIARGKGHAVVHNGHEHHH